jgi:hypothetical protein
LGYRRVKFAKECISLGLQPSFIPDLVAAQEWLTRNEGGDSPKNNEGEETIISQVLKRMPERL